MTKAQARSFARAEISKMSDAEKEWASGAIVDCLSSLDEFALAHKPFIFLGTDTEPNTEEIVGLALMMERVVSVPRVSGDDMQAVIISPFSNFISNRWNILEPVGGCLTDDIDVAVIPLVAFDGLNRAGHGKGYYDRFLASHSCVKIGIAFDCQRVEGLECNDFDIPLDVLVTEKRVITAEGEQPNKYGAEVEI